MQIQVVSKGIDVSDALREQILSRVEDGVSKYFNRPGEAYVSISREGIGFRVDCSVHLPSGAMLQAHRRQHRVTATTEASQHGQAVEMVARLTQYFIIENNRGIGGQYYVLVHRVAASHSSSFLLRHALHIVPRNLTAKRRFINISGITDIANTQLG